MDILKERLVVAAVVFTSLVLVIWSVRVVMIRVFDEGPLLNTLEFALALAIPTAAAAVVGRMLNVRRAGVAATTGVLLLSMVMWRVRADDLVLRAGMQTIPLLCVMAPALVLPRRASSPATQ